MGANQFEPTKLMTRRPLIDHLMKVIIFYSNWVYYKTTFILPAAIISS